MATLRARNYGVDLLRTVSMYMVVVLHVLYFGGILDRVVFTSLSDSVAWLIEAGAIGAVNLYAITTGYVSVGARHRPARLFSLWLDVVFWSLLGTVVFCLIPAGVLDLTELARACLPVMSVRYWYFTAYVLLFLLMPYLSGAVERMSRRTHRGLCVTVVFALSVLPTLAKLFLTDGFGVADGYSAIWLIGLYFIGAYIRLYGGGYSLHRPRWVYLVGYVLFTLGAWASRYAIGAATASLLGERVGTEWLYAYNSPLILGQAVCLFLVFSRLEIRRGTRVIGALASVSFTVMIIHLQKDILNRFITGRLAAYASASVPVMLLAVLAFSAAVYLVCTVLALAQKQLFRWLRVPRLCEWVEEKVLALGARWFGKE